MSRGGRGGGRGGGKRGPDLSWQDEDIDDGPTAHQKNIPGPAFPDRHISTPKPLSIEERDSVRAQLQLRERIRSGPIYTIFEPSVLLDDKGKSNPRAGFDPFNDQERFTKRYHRKKRVIPDLTERGGYTLRLFPPELWPVLDPKRQQTEYWNTLSEDLKARIIGKSSSSRGTKRKRTDKLEFDDSLLDPLSHPANKSDASDGSDSDALLSSTRRRARTAARTRRTDPTTTSAKQKRGLDAEDDYPDNPQDRDEDNPNKEAGGDAGADEDPADSEFGTDDDDDDGGDDYNAEQYFDDGEKDDFGDADDDGDGGRGGDYY